MSLDKPPSDVDRVVEALAAIAEQLGQSTGSRTDGVGRSLVPGLRPMHSFQLSVTTSYPVATLEIIGEPDPDGGTLLSLVDHYMQSPGPGRVLWSHRLSPA